MWQPKKISIDKFISHLNSEFIFKNSKAVLIVGENIDDDSQSSNGSGKSAIIESIIFALTGSSFRKVKSQELIMNNEKKAKVSLFLENKIDNKIVEISRTIELKKSSSILIKINNELIFDTPNKGTSQDANKFIIDLLGISKEDLMNYFVVSKESYQSFLNSSDTKKKEIISRFSGADLIDNVDDVIKHDENLVLDKIRDLDNIIFKKNGAIEIYKKNLEEVETIDFFEQNKKNQINNILDQKKQTSETIFDLDKQIDDLIYLGKQTKDKISSIDVLCYDKDIENLENISNDLTNKIKNLNSEINDNESLIISINKNLKGVVECPKCNHEFSVTNKNFKVDLAKKSLPKIKSAINNCNVSINGINSSKQQFEEQLSDYNDKKVNLIKQKKQFEEKIISLRNKLNSLKDLKSSKLNFLNELDKDIELIKAKKYSNNSNNIEININNLNDEILNLNKEINVLEADKREIVEWYLNFKKFKTYLANKSIKSIEAYSNLFLSKMKTNLNINIQGYKILSNGSLKENINVEVLRNGLLEGNFDKFSSGEKTKIDISTIFSLQKLINLNSKTGGLDLLILDEIIESVDSQGVSEILKNINQLEQTVLVITHANQINDFENYTKVVKSQGYSKIIN